MSEKREVDNASSSSHDPEKSKPDQDHIVHHSDAVVTPSVSEVTEVERRPERTANFKDYLVCDSSLVTYTPDPQGLPALAARLFLCEEMGLFRLRRWRLGLHRRRHHLAFDERRVRYGFLYRHASFSLTTRP